MADAGKGTFRPKRENGELTRTLGNPEHPGRTRGKGAGVPWKKGFPEYDDTYRSRFEEDALTMLVFIKVQA